MTPETFDYNIIMHQELISKSYIGHAIQQTRKNNIT